MAAATSSDPGREVQPVAVTGMGCVCAAGRSLAEAVAAMFRGERDPRPSPRLQTDHRIAYPVFTVPDAWLTETCPSRFGRCAQLLFAALSEALADARLPALWPDGASPGPRPAADAWSHRAGPAPGRVGVCLGTVVGAALDDEVFYSEFHRGRFPRVTPVLRFLRSNPAALVHRYLGLTGPFATVTTACTSGAAAVAQAAAWVRAGVCNLAIAGGTEKLSRLSYDGFISLQITDPEPCRPFDRDRHGLNLGEAAGILVLERESAARARQARIRGRLLGDGNASDAYHLSKPDPQGHGLHRAIANALATSGLTARDVAFINAHGTGTADNDRVEAQVFAQLLPGVPFHSTKGYTGHTLGAAGAIEAAFTLAFLARQSIPASAGFETPDPEATATPVRTVTAVSGRWALSTSVAYGGNNVALVLAGGDP